MPSSGLLTLYHPALDAGSIPSRHPQPKAKRFGLGIQLVWIPACAGMTKKTRGCHPLPSSRTWCGIHSDWIPVLTGMTHPLSSSTESKALRIGDPAPPVIPHLMRDPVLSGFPFSREWQEKDAGMTERKFCVNFIIRNFHPHPFNAIIPLFSKNKKNTTLQVKWWELAELDNKIKN